MINIYAYELRSHFFEVEDDLEFLLIISNASEFDFKIFTIICQSPKRIHRRNLLYYYSPVYHCTIIYLYRMSYVLIF